MPFALLIIGIVLVTVAVRNTQDDFIGLVKGDFSGPGNFFWWVAALVIIGAVGNVQRLKPVADALLVLILIALLLTRGSPSFPGGGFFKQFVEALQGTNTPAVGGVSVGLPGVVSGFGSGGGFGVSLPPISIKI